MATPILMPKLGLSMKTGTISKWMKNEGDKVKKGEYLLEVTTEKITNKIESKVDGILLAIIAPKGSVLPVGALIGVIGEAGEDIEPIIAAAAAKASATAKSGAAKTAAGAARPLVSAEALEKIKISPAARKLAEENGVDYSQVTGTGPEGRITREDVEKAIAEGIGLAEAEEQDDRETVKVLPYEGMRQAIGENMAKSYTSNARVTHHVRMDMSGILAFRKNINEGKDEKHKISVTAILTKAVARALELNPCVNASFTGTEIKVWKDVHIGMAVALQDGLLVPVIRNANTKRLSEVNREIVDLAKRARKNKLTVDEMGGATFTITNLGGYGSVDHFTPIINPPEVAILGVGRTTEQPAVANGQIVVRPIMGISLVFDHRVVDGAPAAEWLALLISLVENPTLIFV
ncbi:MAG: dihydrolipoamide acetyltransferase family protein [Smithellaceae bacterium]|nr:dihydrolipoamide acetyltransferase family protein [Smithellaceae bacterium]